MKKTTLLFLVLLIKMPLFGQSDSSKIKVYLMGTFHFGATSDANKTTFNDLYSAKRQGELTEMATSIVKAKTSKIFVEFPYYAQKDLDSMGKMYMENPNKDTVEMRREMFQIGFRVAKMNPNIKVVAADRQMELPMFKLEEFDAFGGDSLYAPFFKKPYKIKQNRIKLSQSTLQEFYINMNSPQARKVYLSDFLHYALASTHESNFLGTEFTLSWYERNLKIFTNILRNIDPDKDKSIVVLMGSSHTAAIRQFFVDHDRFEIVEMADLFKLK